MIITVLVVLAFFHLFYFIALFKKDFSIVDTAWGLSFLLIFLSGFISSPNELSSRLILLCGLVSIWALRLSGHIFYRNIKLGHEDYRYAQWREDWGEKANKVAYFRVFLLQAFLSLVMASPLILIHYYPEKSPLGSLLDCIGLTLWALGLLLESIADFQKDRFKSIEANQGKVLKSGVWKYSRHPNYFGEALLWWGIFFIVVNHIPFYYAIIGPLVLHFFLLKVSGVSLLEKRYEGSTDYEKYKETTNAFLPWRPKSAK
jgi:steroid 5-alpha reductase family enzyme